MFIVEIILVGLIASIILICAYKFADRIIQWENHQFN